ncbi:2,3-dimethylmalate lyase [Cinnamomum micranthum f. kanehirae]|uniref:2,3-dimethylmalate lyase n=1 Tax=Cinnamomum micranthum f. kanehirae TaxID=337451 RepID=A0A3S3PRD2_9MAGN|nr:2,3-dimethylmalate lyase [Cinnamomum micranthum f. kanehirae]
MRISTYTTQDPTISVSLSPFPIHQQKRPSTPTPQIPILKTGSSFQQLLLVSKPSRQEPRRGFSRLGLRPIASIGEGSVAYDSPAKALRRILETPGIHQGPACYDALSAKLVERAGFKLCFTSGFSISAARLGLPDVGLTSYGEIVDQGFQITQAVSIPVIGDGDNGYGNHMNVKRTVSPKACGHTRGRKVVSREEAVMRIKAAIDARKESGSDIVIVARSDARQAISLEEALWRSRAFADAGADVLFIDALASREEMRAFCDISPLLPKMANMLEGGGKTPILNPIELEEIGFRIVSYPLSLIGVSIRAMEDALLAIKGGRLPPPGSLPSFEEIKETLGFNTYYEEEMRYSTSARQPSYSYQTGYPPTTSTLSNISPATSQDDPRERGERPQDPVVEVVTPYVYDNYGADGSRGPFNGIWSRTLRVKITGRDGLEKLDVRIPAGFLEGMANIIPALGGVNLKAMLDDAAQEVGDNLERGKRLIDINDRMGDRIQVFLE